MRLTEKELEDILYENIQTEEGCRKLTERGLPVSYHPRSIHYRQLNLKRYGIADLVTIRFDENSCIKVNVCELKVTPFEISHLLQLGRYAACISRIVEKVTGGRNWRIDVQKWLIVSEFNERSDHVWLREFFDQRTAIYKANYTFDGVQFDCIVNQSRQWIEGESTDLKDYVDPGPLKKMYKEYLKDVMAQEEKYLNKKFPF